MSQAFQVKQDFSSTDIVIKSSRNILIIIFLMFWLVGWFFGESFALFFLMSEQMQGSAVLFISFWLLAWTFAGFAVLSVILWQLVGKENISIHRGVLTHSKTIFGLGRKRTYHQLDIQEFGFKPLAKNRIYRPTTTGQTPLKTGSISFLYQNKNVSIAKRLNEAEAKDLLQILKQSPGFKREQFI